jgi:hypothetical protein
LFFGGNVSSFGDLVKRDLKNPCDETKNATLKFRARYAIRVPPTIVIHKNENVDQLLYITAKTNPIR